MKNLKQIIREWTLPLWIVGALGCASTSPMAKPDKENEEIPYVVLQALKRSEDSGSFRFEGKRYSCLWGYSMLESTKKDYLNVLAGILAGTVEVSKTGNGYSANGNYSRGLHPEAMQTVLRLADKDSDKIITTREARIAQKDIYEKFAK